MWPLDTPVALICIVAVPWGVTVGSWIASNLFLLTWVCDWLPLLVNLILFRVVPMKMLLSSTFQGGREWGGNLRSVYWASGSQLRRWASSLMYLSGYKAENGHAIPLFLWETQVWIRAPFQEYKLTPGLLAIHCTVSTTPREIKQGLTLTYGQF